MSKFNYLEIIKNNKNINYMNLLLILLVIFIGSACECVPNKKVLNYDKNHNKNYAEALNYAQSNLPKEGVLVQQEDGYAYIKVDDNYIFRLLPKLHAPGYAKPPYFRRANSPGAHISVIYEKENVKLKEVGQKFSFNLRDIIIVHPNKHTSYIVLQVHAPELEALRKSYGLSSKLNNYEFHISLAKKINPRT